MPAPYPQAMRKQLALWVAAGGKITDWCRENAVCLKTACTWSGSDAFRREVAAHRRRAADRAIGRMARHLGKAVGKIDRLIEQGRDDGAKLAAAGSLVGKVLDDRGHAELKARLRRLGERIDSID
jgi:hypothetical protein